MTDKYFIAKMCNNKTEAIQIVKQLREYNIKCYYKCVWVVYQKRGVN
jgi:hypothetical protein